MWKKYLFVNHPLIKKIMRWLTLPARLEQHLKEAVKYSTYIFKRFRHRSQPNFIINSTTTQPKFTIIQETAIFFNWVITSKYLHGHSYNPWPCYKLFQQLKWHLPVRGNFWKTESKKIKKRSTWQFKSWNKKTSSKKN